MPFDPKPLSVPSFKPFIHPLGTGNDEWYFLGHFSGAPPDREEGILTSMDVLLSSLSGHEIKADAGALPFPSRRGRGRGRIGSIRHSLIHIAHSPEVLSLVLYVICP